MLSFEERAYKELVRWIEMPQMKIYCPCGKKCSGYSGSARKCNRVETSKTIPSRFINHLSRKTGEAAGSGDWGNALGGALATFGSIWLSGKDETSYEVWQCPACHCEVLYQTTKQEGGMRKEQMGAISECD